MRTTRAPGVLTLDDEEAASLHAPTENVASR
jgi:hypothetical protein